MSTGPVWTADDEGLRAWLAAADAIARPAPPPLTVGRRVTLPLRAVRRFRGVARQVGTREATVLGARYVSRRLRARA